MDIALYPNKNIIGCLNTFDDLVMFFGKISIEKSECNSTSILPKLSEHHYFCSLLSECSSALSEQTVSAVE